MEPRESTIELSQWAHNNNHTFVERRSFRGSVGIGKLAISSIEQVSF